MPSHSLQGLADPDKSLADLANQHQITLNALTLWLASPTAAKPIAQMETACAVRLRLVVATRLPQAVAAVVETIENLRSEERDDKALVASADPIDRPDWQEEARDRRGAIRRLGELLIKFANLRPPPVSADPASNSQGERTRSHAAAA